MGLFTIYDADTIGRGEFYTASVEVNDGNQHLVMASTTVTVLECNCHFRCPTISVTCPSDVDQDQPIPFTASISPAANLTYNWSVSAGAILNGQGTSSITVDISGPGGQSVTATLEVGGLDPVCWRTVSCSTPVVTPPPAISRFDKYRDIRFNDEKARLDNYAIHCRTNQEPRATSLSTATAKVQLKQEQISRRITWSTRAVLMRVAS